MASREVSQPADPKAAPVQSAAPTEVVPPRGTVGEVLLVSTRLGLSSFGGPVAHLGYFRAEYVHRRKWLDEAAYADLIALSQFLPGPASSKLGIAIGIFRAGLWGGLAAWAGFTLPSAFVLALFAFGVVEVGSDAGWLHGLKVVAVAVVAQAVWAMASSLCPDRPRITLAIMSAVLVFLLPALGLPAVFGQVAIIAAGALVGWLLLAPPPTPAPMAGPVPYAALPIHIPYGHGLAITAWALFFGLLVGLPLLRTVVDNSTLALVDSFYRSGSLVFGGGHVVLPLLQAEVVAPGWVTDEQFLAGYGAAQAVPGPLFTFSAYLGAVRGVGPNGWLGATIALVAIFLPAFLMVIGSLPYWERLRSRRQAQAVLRGVNAAVVGLLLAALYQPVWTSAILRPADFALALAAFGALVFWKLPPWLVVLLAAVAGGVIGRFG